MQHHFLVVVYIYQGYLWMEIQKQDERNLGSFLFNKKYPLIDVFFSRVWLSGVGIADILEGTINGTVHQHIVN